MAKQDRAAIRLAKERAHAYARYTINLQRQFTALQKRLKFAYGQPARDAAAMRSQHVVALQAIAEFLERVESDGDLAQFAKQFIKFATALEGLNRGVRSPILDPAGVTRSDPPTVWLARAHVALAVEVMRRFGHSREAAAKWAARRHPGLQRLITESAAHRSANLEKAIISWCKDFSSRRVRDDVAARAYSKALDNWKTWAPNCGGDQLEAATNWLLQEALTLNDESLKSVDLASGDS
jgi:hypothetical protein